MMRVTLVVGLLRALSVKNINTWFQFNYVTLTYAQLELPVVVQTGKDGIVYVLHLYAIFDD